jgi:hypothetical protein
MVDAGALAALDLDPAVIRQPSESFGDARQGRDVAAFSDLLPGRPDATVTARREEGIESPQDAGVRKGQAAILKDGNGKDGKRGHCCKAPCRSHGYPFEAVSRASQ